MCLKKLQTTWGPPPPGLPSLAPKPLLQHNQVSLTQVMGQGSLWSQNPADTTKGCSAGAQRNPLSPSDTPS